LGVSVFLDGHGGMEKQYSTKYPSDVSDEELALLAPYLTFCREDAPQREHSLRAVFNGLCYIERTGNQWRFMPGDLLRGRRCISRRSAGCGPVSSRSLWRMCVPCCTVRRTQAAADGDDRGQPHPAVDAGVGSAGRIRRRQATQRVEDACGGPYAGTSACIACDRSERTGPRTGRAAGRRDSTDYRSKCLACLCRPRLHRANGSRCGGPTRHPVAGPQTYGGKTWLGSAAPTMGRRS
jgi:transposase